MEQGVQTSGARHKGAKKDDNVRTLLSAKTMGTQVKMEPVTNRLIIADEEGMKKKAREAMIKPQYNVFDDYFQRGCFQYIAKSSLFSNLTFAVIILNSVWIGVDLDHNNSATLLDAHPVFQAGENTFCAFFALEVFVRFMAFRKKKYCVRDLWFGFDALLVLFMIAETWILPGVMLIMGMTAGSDLGPVSMLRIARMSKMARMARMVRLVRAFPELVVLLKGITTAIRSVMTFFVLWLIMIYIYAVIFKQLTLDQDIGTMYFETIPIGMNTLMLRGIFPAFAEIMDDIANQYPVVWPILLSFILLASLTMMNMLIGVLVNVVAVLGAVEKESALVKHVASALRHAMVDIGKDASQPLNLDDFRKLVMEPEIGIIVQQAGADVVVILEQSDIIFEAVAQEDLSLEPTISFEKFIETILNMRTSNAATVKDINSQLRLLQRTIRESILHSEQSLSAGFKKDLTRMRTDLGAALEHIRKTSGEEDDFDDDEDDDAKEETVVQADAAPED